MSSQVSHPCGLLKCSAFQHSLGLQVLDGPLHCLSTCLASGPTSLTHNVGALMFPAPHSQRAYRGHRTRSHRSQRNLRNSPVFDVILTHRLTSLLADGNSRIVVVFRTWLDFGRALFLLLIHVGKKPCQLRCVYGLCRAITPGASLAVTLFSMHFSCAAFGKKLVFPHSRRRLTTFDLSHGANL